VLCVDNETAILDGMTALLERWGCEVRVARDEVAARARLADGWLPDLVLMDYHLGDGADGLAVLDALPLGARTTVRSVIITADRSPELEARVDSRGLALLRKPLRPAALRALLSNLLRDARAGQSSPTA
jgi:CheY-like chemotaxis protein